MGWRGAGWFAIFGCMEGGNEPTLTIRLLGGLSIGSSSAISVIRSHDARSLIGFLCVHRSRPLLRSQVAGTLWPDLSEADARTRLRRALHRAAVDIESDVFLRQAGTIRLDPQLANLDITEFVDLTNAGSTSVNAEDQIDILERALHLYRGELLEGLDAEWVIPHRDALRRRYIGALDRLCDLHSASRRDNAALRYARRLASEDPWNEHAHRRVIWLLNVVGRPHEAVLQFETCSRLLRDGLNIKPSPATRELVDSIVLDREAVRPAPSSADWPLMGRDRERSAVASLLDGALSGSGRVLLLEGDTGIGKSRLMSTVVADAAWRGIAVIETRGTPGDGPYAAVRTALASIEPGILEVHLDRPSRDRLRMILDPSQALDQGPSDSTSLHDSAARALTAPAYETPLLIAVDAGHELDRASAATVAQLGELTRSFPVVLVVAYRHLQARRRPAIWKTLLRLDRIPGRMRIALGPLSPGQTEALARSIVGHEIDQEAAAALHRATGGVPSLVAEALRNPAAATRGASVESAIRDLARNLVETRLEELSTSAVDALQIFALAARPLSDETARHLNLTGIQELISHGLIIRQGDTIEPASDFIRTAIVGPMATQDAVEIHRRIGEALEKSEPTEFDALAHHFLLAGDSSNAAQYKIAAAEQAASVHEYERALEDLEEADLLVCEKDTGLSRAPVLRRLIKVLDILGLRSRQLRALDALASVATAPAEEIDVLSHRARWLAQGDNLALARTTAEEALAVARAAGDRERVVGALATLATVECRAGNALAGAALLDTAEGFGRFGTREQANARNALGQNLMDLGRFEEAETQLLAAQALFKDLEDIRGETDVISMLAAIQMQRGHADDAVRRYQLAMEICQQHGYREGVARAECNCGIALAISGYPAEALRHFLRGAETLRELGHDRRYETALLNASWLQHAVFGEDELASSTARSTLRRSFDETDLRTASHAEALLGSIAARQGIWSQAVEHFARAIQSAAEAGDVWLETQNLAHYAAAAVGAGSLTTARELIRRGDHLAKRFEFSDLSAAFEVTKAEIELRVGDPSNAVTQLGSLATNPPDLGEIRVATLQANAMFALGAEEAAETHLGYAWQRATEMLSGVEEPRRHIAMSTVPILKELQDLWTQQMPEQRTILAAPTTVGPRQRPPDDELIPVTITTRRASDKKIQDPVERRQRQILRILQDLEKVPALITVRDLARIFDVSEKTIARDLRRLRVSGHPAVVTRGSINRDPPPQSTP